ncbi:Formamidopyrimidine-DNA glycosylase [Mycoplasmopsis meleagridis]|uniref:Formamidopyrimidine-DNA glycosylase n=1 Tax=Mycoplasmopsis meleagridis ATCC 25294 TaxID=1264554 RepID=A0A0F5H188_9BACT|nr:bifunctional DNA-formamidopyrimidine glycosylase/DNA-(apurinic or apyrimidinic site) lyase [Mycoplasmopsis meleagridis]KKB26978.1 Formamidopyrimidine-DNA glycosylase [Mycoplasmopsis meleagridis ATCC 25294]OAD18567.1 Formamidopyrimidine-DNA glycosylase [Mycoplasmopsis meleagridis]VEU77564.1 DNA-formamidopyrimidine glycosylase [Mycoplasmopsis meleagridis]
MPELPEVITVTNDLNNKVSGKTIKLVEVFKDKMIKDIDVENFINLLVNETIINVTNLGKHIIFNLTNHKHIISHLRMTGKYNTYKRRRQLEAHDYVVFTFSDESALFYNDYRQFGTFHFKYSNELFTTPPLNKLGKVPKETNIDELYEKVKNKKIPIKTLLLDQTYILGIGNIYANEALFDVNINPTEKVSNLTKNEFKKLIISAGRIMDESLKNGGSSIQSYRSVDGAKGNFQNFLKVHNHEGDACVMCGHKIEKIFVNQRGTYFCPKCQKLKK